MSGSEQEATRHPTRRGFWRTVAWPARAYGSAFRQGLNTEAIAAEAQNIRRLAANLRAPPPKGIEIVTGPGGTIDVPLTAEVAGVPVAMVEAMLAMRLRRTAIAFRACLSVGALGLVAWVVSALWLAPGSTGPVSGMMTALLVLTLGAKALQAALQNWRVRTLRLGSVADFLAAEDWWPRNQIAIRER